VQKGVRDLSDVYENRVEPVRSIQLIGRDLQEVRFRMAAVLLDQMPAVGSANQLKEATAEIPKEWAAFKLQTSRNPSTPETAALIQKVDAQIPGFLSFSGKLAKAYAAEDKTAISSLLEDEWPAVQSKLVKPIDQLIPQEQLAVKESYETSRKHGATMVLAGLGVFLISIVLLGGLGTVVLRSILKPLRLTMQVLSAVASGDLTQALSVESHDEIGVMAQSLNQTVEAMRKALEAIEQSAEQVASASVELSMSAAASAEGASNQQEQTTQAVAAMNEMSRAINETADHSQDAANVAARATERARQAAPVVDDILDRMRRIASSVSTAAATMEQLGKSSEQIGKIVTVIGGIANQTNLLALNAAIEAARAGEQGRGFAVVAGEVRNLAERTTHATKEITEMVSTMQGETQKAAGQMQLSTSDVARGVEVTSQANSVLKEVIQATDQLGSVITLIATASSHQANAAESVNQSVESIAKIAAESASSAQNSAQACEDLSHLASNMGELVRRFDLRTGTLSS
jgi:methyl-accepting chemotaxis protein